MIKCSFYYSRSLLNKINNNISKVANIVIEICLAIMLVSALVLFVTGNSVIGVVVLVAFVLVLGNMVISNKTIERSNRMLLNQRVNIDIKAEEMVVKNMLGDKQLSKITVEYKAIKSVKILEDLIYVYIGKVSAIIIPKNSFANQQDCAKAIDLFTNNYNI